MMDVKQKQIAKNTIMLYIRMVVIMLVTLYISRVVLEELGETDFGIYNIVGSVVVSLVFIQNTLMSATQRFLSYEIGKGDIENFRRVFSMSLNIHFLFIGVVILLLETIGLWFLNNVLSIPETRMTSANIVYQLSICTFALNMWRIPYNAVIVSFEKMDIFAILSIIEAFLKLAIAYVLIVVSVDKLVVYGILVFIVTLVVNALYIIYCRHNYNNESSYKYEFDLALCKKMLGFSGWNMIGGVASIASTEGPNYFMNVYLGVGVNAAMGLAKQVSSAVYQFASNFQTAFNPQIVKAYASNDKEYITSLIHNTSLLSFYLLFIIAFPFILGADLIFELWLVDVPQYAVEFCILIMISQIIASLSSPMWMIVHATGEIRNYQLTIAAINLIIIPASWLILEIGYSPIYILSVNIFISLSLFVYRLIYLRNKLDFDIQYFCKKVIAKCSILVLLIVPIPLLTCYYANNATHIILAMGLSILISVTVFGFFGIDKVTRKKIISNILKRL